MKAGPMLFILAGFMALTAAAQGPVFEVATVRPNHSGESMRSFPHMANGVFTAQSASLMTLLGVAYGVNPTSIEAPGWVSTEKYDINAKAPSGASDEQIAPLLKALLKERFHLEVHFETREMPVYDLVVGKDGSKLPLFDAAKRPETPPNRGQAVLTGNGGTTGNLASGLSNITGRPVMDKTGMDGRYSWVLSFAPLTATGTEPPVAADLFVAIQEQLGLRLVANKASLQILVIDGGERVPIEN